MDPIREGQSPKHIDACAVWPIDLFPQLFDCANPTKSGSSALAKHSATKEQPPHQATFEDKVRRLTTEAEQGLSISAELNGMTIRERVKIAKAMDYLNAADRKTDSNLPDLKIGIGRELTRIEIVNWQDQYDGPEHLLNISRVENPNAPLPFLRGESQVYAMPGQAAEKYKLSTRFIGRFSASDIGYQDALNEDTVLSSKNVPMK